MPRYSLELANSTAWLRCSCCTAGTISVCGFVRQWERPYSVYYALMHNSRQDIFARLSISVGEWRHAGDETRFALCIEVTPRGEDWNMSVLEPMHSPQQNLTAFGQWLGPDAGGNNPAVREIVEVAGFVVTNDPALRSYLSGQKPDFYGREASHITDN